MEVFDRAQNARTSSERPHERKAALISADATNNIVCCATGNHSAAFSLATRVNDDSTDSSVGSGSLIWEREFSSPILTLYASHGYVVVGTTDKRVHVLRAQASNASAVAASATASVTSYENVTTFDIPKKTSAISIVSVSDSSGSSSGGSGDSGGSSGGSSDKLYLLIADKFADVYSISLTGLSSSSTLNDRHFLLQHPTSSITAMHVEPNLGWMVTADQDEKIRVSSFPATHLIKSYCLGHTALVSSVAVSLPSSSSERAFVLSGGGDGSLRCWEPSTGKLLDTIMFQAHNQTGTLGEARGEAQLLVTSLLCSGSGDARSVTFAVIDAAAAESSVHSCTLSKDGKLTMSSTQEWAATGAGDAWVVQDIVGVTVAGAGASAACVGIALALNAHTGEFEWLSLRDSVVTAEQLAPLSTWTEKHKVVVADGDVVATGVLTEAPRGSRKREREAAATAKEARVAKVSKK